MNKPRLKELEMIVKDASSIFYDEKLKQDVEVKGYANYVSAVDVAIQDYIQSECFKRWPEVMFVGEEKNNDEIDVNGCYFILDPVDGTTNFLRDLGRSVISLAYVDCGKLELAVLYNPYRKELFTAQKGKGAFKNGERIHVSNKTSLSESLMLVGIVPYDKSYADYYFDVIKDTYMHCTDIRRTGSAALDFTDIASGRADGYFEHIYAWDRAAGMLLVEEAGGVVCKFDGTPCTTYGFSDVIASCNQEVANELMEILNKHKL